MKLEEAKKMQEISRERYKSEEQKSALENIKLLYKSLEAIVKLFNDYPSITQEAKYKTIHGKGLTILTPKQILQKLLVAVVQVKGSNTSD